MRFNQPQSDLIRLSDECWKLLLNHAERVQAETPRAALEALIVGTLTDAEDAEKALKQTAEKERLKTELAWAEKQIQSSEHRLSTATEDLERATEYKAGLLHRLNS